MASEIRVDVVDGNCSLRRRRIAVRAEAALLAMGISSDQYTVRDFAEVSDWQRDIAGPESVAETNALILHTSPGQSDWKKAVDIFYHEFVEKSLPGSAALLSYTGSEDKSVPQTGDLIQNEVTWWKHRNRVLSVWDYSDRTMALAEVGLKAPDVETFLQGLLSRESGSVEHTSDHPHQSEADWIDAEVRHALVNGIGPLLASTIHALDRSEPIRAFSTLRNHLLTRLASLRSRLPRWISVTMDRIQGIKATGVETTPIDLEALNALVLDLGRLDAFARSIGYAPVLSVTLAENIRTSWSEKAPRLLWIDDERAWFDAIGPMLKSCGFEITFSDDPAHWVKHLAEIPIFDVILLDIILEGHSDAILEAFKVSSVPLPTTLNDRNAGLCLLNAIRQVPGAPPVFMLSARESADPIHACTKLGARGYLVKGRIDYSTFLVSLRNDIVDRRATAKRGFTPRNPRLIVGGPDDPLRPVLTQLDAIASSGSRGPILFLGEPGVGKEELARELQARSPRNARPFVVINCSALPAALAESEFFGHAKGSFTDARSDRVGKFEEAEGGFVFLDEIDKLDLALQPKLLRVIESRSFERVGENRTRKFDAVVIVTTNDDLRRAAERGRFNGPLATRLATSFAIRVPSLSARKQVIPFLAPALCNRICEEMGHPRRVLTEEAVEWLTAQVAGGRFDGLGGNVRGLKNLLEQTVVYHLKDEVLDSGALKFTLQVAESPAVASQEMNLIREAAKLLAQHVSTQTAVSLFSIEEKVRAELLLALIRTMGRADVCKLFNMTRETFRKHLQILRDKGLIPPDV